MEDKQSVYFREIREMVNVDTGEYVAEERITRSRVPKEPQFIKIYLSHLLMLTDIPKGLNGILFELIKGMNYKNEVVWNAGIKDRICQELNCSESNVRKALTEFKKKKILIEQGRGIFLVNPYVFGRGTWENVHQLRLTVDLTPTRQIVSGEVISDETLTELGIETVKSLEIAFDGCCPPKEEVCGIVTEIR